MRKLGTLFAKYFYLDLYRIPKEDAFVKKLWGAPLPGRIRVSTTQIDIKKTARNLIIPFSFIFPILILYILDPSLFEVVWKGRGPLLFFLWLLFLELALGWKKLLKGEITWTRFKIAAVVVAVAAPTIYVVAVYPLGLRSNIVKLGESIGVPFGSVPPGADIGWFTQFSWPLSLEYIFFTVFFAASVLLMYQIGGLKRFSVSLFFLGATSFFYMIDTFYPFGTFTVLQAFAPITASFSVHVLNWMGYGVRLASYQIEGMPILIVPGLPLPLAIGWPCAGVHSLFIYTFVILFFLKEAPFSLQRETVRAAIPRRLRFMARSKRMNFLLKRKVIRATIMESEKIVVNFFRMVPLYIIVCIGAVGTFIVNVLRIVTICIIGVNIGEEAMKHFHSYYGELFFIAWIMIYPLTIIYSHKIWAKLSTLGVKLKETGRKVLSRPHR